MHLQHQQPLDDDTTKKKKTPYEKYTSSNMIIRDILSNHSVETINRKRASYLQQKKKGRNDAELKVFHGLYNKYNRNKKIV